MPFLFTQEKEPFYGILDSFTFLTAAITAKARFQVFGSSFQPIKILAFSRETRNQKLETSFTRVGFIRDLRYDGRVR